jgi:hypothetical protein
VSLPGQVQSATPDPPHFWNSVLLNIGRRPGIRVNLVTIGKSTSIDLSVGHMSSCLKTAEASWMGRSLRETSASTTTGVLDIMNSSKPFTLSDMRRGTPFERLRVGDFIGRIPCFPCSDVIDFPLNAMSTHGIVRAFSRSARASGTN